MRKKEQRRSSRSTPRINKMQKGRPDHNQQSSTETVLFGIHPISAILKKDPSRIIRVLYQGDLKGARGNLINELRALNIEVDHARTKQIEHYAGDEQHQGVLAFVNAQAYQPWSEMISTSGLLIALDQVTDPRNFGAILRSAEALGVRGALITSNRCARPGPVVAKTSAGASELIPIAMVSNLATALEEAKVAGFQIIGAHMNGDAPSLIEWNKPTVLVIGAEGKGLRNKTQQLCNQFATIPLIGQTESLNASVAAAILIYEASVKK